MTKNVMLRLNDNTDEELKTLAQKKGLPKATFAKMLVTERLEQILGGEHAGKACIEQLSSKLEGA